MKKNQLCDGGCIMNPLISVVIPVYNMGDFIQPCVNSVLNQTYTHFEIIIINDGSKDNTESVCAKLADENSNIILFNQENQGVSVARNKGMELSKGDYVIFLDADDTMPANALKDLLEAAKKHNSDMTIGKISPNEQIPIGVFEEEEFLVKCLEDNPIAYYSCRILYKYEFLCGISFEKGFSCGEDSYFVFECARKRPKVATIDKCVYSYTRNLNSVTRSAFTIERYDSLYQLLDKKESIILSYFPQYLDLFYHLKVKTQMMLLTNFASVKGNKLKKEETETWARFNEFKTFFRAELPYSNSSLYNFLIKKGYRRYKLYRRFTLFVKHILKR